VAFLPNGVVAWGFSRQNRLDHFRGEGLASRSWFVWSVWFIWPVWFNQTYERDQMTQI